MNAKQTRPHHAPMFTLGDIYYILFRHKWKIAGFAAVGVLAAVITTFAWPKIYTSEAKLLVKYVTESRMPVGPNGQNEHTIDPDANGRNVINTELQILTSRDLCLEVVTNLTAAKILGRDGNVVAAANVLHGNLEVEA